MAKADPVGSSMARAGPPAPLPAATPGVPVAPFSPSVTHLIVLGDGLVGAPHGPEGLGFLPQCVFHVPALGLP